MSEKKESKQCQAQSEFEALDSSSQTNQPKKYVQRLKEQMSIKKRNFPQGLEEESEKLYDYN